MANCLRLLCGTDLFQQLVGHPLSLQFFEELLSELLQAGEGPFGCQLGTTDLLLLISVHGNVKVETRRRLSPCKQNGKILKMIFHWGKVNVGNA